MIKGLFFRMHHCRGAQIRPDAFAWKGDVQRDRRDDQNGRRKRRRKNQLSSEKRPWLNFTKLLFFGNT